MIATIVYWGLMIVGAGLLALLVTFHQRLMPQERGIAGVEWEPLADKTEDRGVDTLDMHGEQVRVAYQDGTLHFFAAPRLKMPKRGWAIFRLNDRPLLAMLDRTFHRRVYVIDTALAARGGAMAAGLVSWWRHGTGFLLAAGGPHLLEVHRGFGHDRLYLLDPLRTVSWQSFGLGIERTIVCPCRNTDRVWSDGRFIYLGKGDDLWRTPLAESPPSSETPA